MKELSIEEKAKAYDEAIKRAKILYNDKNEIGYANAESVLEEVFPLLKESKDERIRKEIINYFAKGKEYLSLCSIGKDDILAWLEKQAEQKPTLRERYKNIVESEWFKKTHNGMSVSNDEEPKWTDDDEKIRKALIEYFNEQCDMSDWNGVYGYQVVAWLEKQGEKNLATDFSDLRTWKYIVDAVWTEKEGMGQYLDSPFTEEVAKKLQKRFGNIKQKSVEKVEPKFHEGEWITNGDYTWKIVEVKPLDYILQSQDGNIVDDTISHVDEQFHSFAIEDAKDGDVLACNEEILLFKSYSVQGRISLYCWYNGQTGNFHSKGVTDTLITTRNKICPAIKEQRDTLERAMTNAGYRWNKEELKLEKI